MNPSIDAVVVSNAPSSRNQWCRYVPRSATRGHAISDTLCHSSHRGRRLVIGKANLHELALGCTSATSDHGPVRNPRALERNPGGSSGGSAAAVAANLCYGALGTDTGGPFRRPCRSTTAAR